MGKQEIREREKEVGERAVLYYQDHEAYKQEFFSHVARQKTPAFHKKVEKRLWAGKRQVGFKMFRDAAKTSLLRIFLSKRCAYGISRTIVIVSKSEHMACLTLNWLKNEVETNEKWASFYGLKASPAKWSNDDIEIIHETLGITIRITARGFSGQIRGTNVNSYRPDLIIVDDADDEDSTATAEQCKKTLERFFGTIVPALAPYSENPEAMICVLQTPLREGDIITTLEKSKDWEITAVSCFDENGESAWPERYSTEQLLQTKASRIEMNMLSLWLRENEVTLGVAESAFFKPEWLLEYSERPEFFERIVIAIDPASSVRKTADDNAIVMWGRVKDKNYLIREHAERGMNHIDTCNVLFDEFIPQAKALCKGLMPTIVVEVVGYQKIIKDEIVQQQKSRKEFFEVKGVASKRNKFDRMEQAFKGKAFAGTIYCHSKHVKFKEQFCSLGKGYTGHDDVLDASSMAVDELGGGGMGEIILSSKKRLFGSLGFNTNDSLRRF